MTKKKAQERKQVAPKATNKTKGSSTRAQPKKTRTNNTRKRPASDDDSSSDEAPAENSHARSRKKARKVVEEVQPEEEEEAEEKSDSEGGSTEDEVSDWFHISINLNTYLAIGRSKRPWRYPSFEHSRDANSEETLHERPDDHILRPRRCQIHHGW